MCKFKFNLAAAIQLMLLSLLLTGCICSSEPETTAESFLPLDQTEDRLEFREVSIRIYAAEARRLGLTPSEYPAKHWEWKDVVNFSSPMYGPLLETKDLSVHLYKSGVRSEISGRYLVRWRSLGWHHFNDGNLGVRVYFYDRNDNLIYTWRPQRQTSVECKDTSWLRFIPYPEHSLLDWSVFDNIVSARPYIDPGFVRRC